MSSIKVKGYQSIVVSLEKALLLNTYLKEGFIKIINDSKKNFEIEILSENPIIKQSLLKA